MIEKFLKGLLWGSFFFLPWGATLFIGILLGLTYRSLQVVIVFFLFDVMFSNTLETLFLPQLPLTILAIILIIVGNFLSQYVSLPVFDSIKN